MRYGLLVLLNLLIITAKIKAQVYIPKFDVQGHRGARGLMPENTTPGFLMALDSGVTTLELDVVITRDKQVVVSHEPWMASMICLDSAGNTIQAKQEKKHNIFGMTWDQVKTYDCGSRIHADFLGQQKFKIGKPLLEDVILMVENHIKNYTFYEVDYNIEIKSEPKTDNKFHPKPPEYSELVYQLIDQYLPWDRVVIQSFDFRVLKYWHERYPDVRLALLVENLNTIDENLKLLGFTPSVYSPDYTLLSKGEIKRCHDLNMRVIPWTVNDIKEMEELSVWGVDGIITDYPNHAKQLGYTINSSSSPK